MSVPPTLFPICTLRLSTRTFLPADATQSSSSAHITSRTAETEISSAWQYRRNAEDFHSPAAKMTPIGEPAAASEMALPTLADDFVPQEKLRPRSAPPSALSVLPASKRSPRAGSLSRTARSSGGSFPRRQEPSTSNSFARGIQASLPQPVWTGSCCRCHSVPP